MHDLIAAKKSQSDGKEFEHVDLRPEVPADEAVLFQVYACTRVEELDHTGWDAATRQAFLAAQFQAMRRGYAGMFPRAENSIIVVRGVVAGRQLLDEDAHWLCVVDLALLPQFQNQGIGTRLMTQVQQRAIAAAKPIRLHVLLNNRAIRFYTRLGFQPVHEAGAHLEMIWRPHSS